MQILRPICLALALAGLAACSDDDDVVKPSFTDGAQLVAYDAAANYKGSHEVLLERSSALTFEGLEGVQPTDEFAARNRATGERTYLNWGYKYDGIKGDEQGNYQRVYYNDIILVGLGFADNWRVGDYYLELLRGSEAQQLDQFRFVLLKDIETDDSKVQGGVFGVKAKGWDVPGTGTPIDTLQLVDKASGQTVQKMASGCTGDGTEFEIVQFSRDGLPSGDYELWLARWNFGLRQKIGEFGYFNYCFVDSDPMAIDSEGDYLLKFRMKEVTDDARITVTTASPYLNYYVDQNVPLSADNYDASTQVYTYKLSADKWRRDPVQGMTFAVSINIGGVRTNVSGTASLP